MTWDDLSQKNFCELQDYCWGEMQFCKYSHLFAPAVQSVELSPQLTGQFFGLFRAASEIEPSAFPELSNQIKVTVELVIKFLTLVACTISAAKNPDFVNSVQAFCALLDLSVSGL